jgi:hypothetical protein
MGLDSSVCKSGHYKFRNRSILKTVQLQSLVEGKLPCLILSLIDSSLLSFLAFHWGLLPELVTPGLFPETGFLHLANFNRKHGTHCFAYV